LINKKPTKHPGLHRWNQIHSLHSC